MSTRPYQELLLVEELLEAANHLDIAQRYRVADRLRQRAAWVRDFPRVLSGDLDIPGVVTAEEMFTWLTGPIPAAETAPTTKET